MNSSSGNVLIKPKFKETIDPDHDLKFEMIYGQDQSRNLYYQHVQLSKIGNRKIDFCEKSLNETLKQIDRTTEICRKEIENYDKIRSDLFQRQQMEIRKHVIAILKSIENERKSFQSLSEKNKLMLVENKHYIINNIFPDLRDNKTFHRSIYMKPSKSTVDDKGRVQLWSKRELVLQWEQKLQNLLDTYIP